jgi:alginate O-acetyltransferase complex protein AlgF
VATVAALDLKRRGGVSIIFTGSNGSYTATAVDNAFFRAE